MSEELKHAADYWGYIRQILSPYRKKIEEENKEGEPKKENIDVIKSN
jgi:hypothetical protein